MLEEDQLKGSFKYKRTPMDPPGMKVFTHETPQQSQTWDFNGKEGWCIVTSPLHYRCYLIYVPDTRGGRT